MNDTLIDQLIEKVKKHFENHPADHDYFHIERVYKLAMLIQQKEGGDAQVVACAALLHDISDHKLNGGLKNDGGRVAELILAELEAPSEIIDRVVSIVDAVSFKGALVPDSEGAIELQIVRDADRLDAMGAIGIARAFHYGGRKDRSLFLPDVPPVLHDSFEQYSTDQGHTLNHFHEKLLLLFDRLQTSAAREIGRKRHRLLEDFVSAFYQEWKVE